MFRKARPFFFRVCLLGLKHTLKKKGRAFRNIGTEKYISQTVKSALLLYYLFYNLLLIRSFTTGSGTFILSRWSLLVQILVPDKQPRSQGLSSSRSLEREKGREEERLWERGCPIRRAFIQRFRRHYASCPEGRPR